MAYYMAYGRGGVAVTLDSSKLPKMGWYIKDLQYTKFDTFGEAEQAALAHLDTIVPEGVQKPDMIVLDQMVFKSSLVKTYIAKKEEAKDENRSGERPE